MALSHSVLSSEQCLVNRVRCCCHPCLYLCCPEEGFKVSMVTRGCQLRVLGKMNYIPCVENNWLLSSIPAPSWECGNALLVWVVKPLDQL